MTDQELIFMVYEMASNYGGRHFNIDELRKLKADRIGGMSIENLGIKYKSNTPKIRRYLEAMKVPKPKKIPKTILDDLDIPLIIELYEKDVLVEDICARFKIGKPTLYKALKRGGATTKRAKMLERIAEFRDLQGEQGSKRRVTKLTEIQKFYARQDLKKEPIEQVAEKYGLTVKELKREIKEEKK